MPPNTRPDIRGVNGIIKSLQDLKVFTQDNSVVSFYSHPVDGNNDESALFATTTTLIGAFKTICLNQSIALERPNSSSAQDVSLPICYS